MASRPIILGIVGDSAAGKTTLSRGLVQLLGADTVTHVCTDDYHKYDRKQRAELAITPLDPDCNYLDIMAQHLLLLRQGDPILKPVYNHGDGSFSAPTYVMPEGFTVIEGLLGYHTPEMRAAYDVRVYLDPPEDLRRQWKVSRDSTRRGYTEEEVLADLERREPDSASFIRPQKRHADIIVSFAPGENDDQEHLAAELTLRESLPHPDLGVFVEQSHGAITLAEQEGQCILQIPGDLDRERAAEIEGVIWDRMHFASHLRTEQLGEFKIGNDRHRSESLGLVQLLILYHLATARATVALGGDGSRNDENLATA